MKKTAAGFLTAVLCFLLCACGSVTDGDVNAMEVMKDGSITASSVGSFDKDYYDINELRKETETAVKAYNASAGQELIKLIKCSADKERARVVLFYSSGSDYAAFNSVTFLSGTLKEALSGGADPDAYVFSSDRTLKTTLGELEQKNQEYGFIEVNEPLLVKAPGKIVYTSSNAKVDKNGNARASGTDEAETLLSSPCYIIYEE
ncbi:MAG TPA: hypothetical protein PLN48_03435 [Lachnospiraceae bacterium]|nr:hypothetical protein [Lachnospiraceae bacterium]